MSKRATPKPSDRIRTRKRVHWQAFKISGNAAKQLGWRFEAPDDPALAKEEAIRLHDVPEAERFRVSVKRLDG